jgi:transposase
MSSDSRKRWKPPTSIDEIDQEADAHVEPFRALIRLLATNPGIGDLSARVIRAAIGSDMSRFSSNGHLVSWAGLCPRLSALVVSARVGPIHAQVSSLAAGCFPAGPARGARAGDG